MNKRLLKLKKIICLTLTLVLLSIPCVSFAAEQKGSLQVVVKDSSGTPVAGVEMYLYLVASPEGVLQEAFAEAGVSSEQLLTEKYNRNSAKTLYGYVNKTEGITGEKRTTDSTGTAHYTGLEKGIYLVGIPDREEADFNPFLLHVPTVINGVEEFYLKALPKVVVPGGGGSGDQEKPPADPTDPENPSGDPDHPSDEEEGEVLGAVDEVEQDKDKEEEEEEPLILGAVDIIPQTGVTRFPIWLLNGFGAVSILCGAFLLHRAGAEEEYAEEECDADA